MNCIDAIEGTVKSILRQVCQASVEADSDDSDYVQKVKVILKATEKYAKKNRDVVPQPEILGKVLYEYSRSLWLNRKKTSNSSKNAANKKTLNDENHDYQVYYYDYLFHNDQYPL